MLNQENQTTGKPSYQGGAQTENLNLSSDIKGDERQTQSIREFPELENQPTKQGWVATTDKDLEEKDNDKPFLGPNKNEEKQSPADQRI